MLMCVVSCRRCLFVTRLVHGVHRFKRGIHDGGFCHFGSDDDVVVRLPDPKRADMNGK